ncbi:MAG TPA: Ku protein [Thermoanaerobaculia bacterium]|nr:Ku protein [Thermoanaerobaculia bacterium]
MAAETATAGLRTFWSGTITFGLVSVPISLFAATRTRGTALRLVDKNGAPVERRYVCSKDGKELDWDDIVRGYEVKKGTFVIVTDEELEAIEPRKTREIDLRTFVPVDQIDPKYFDSAYFLVPSAATNKAYRLLAHVMEKNQRAGIATFVMRAKEYVVAIIAENGILRAETLRFADELRSAEDLELPKPAKPKRAAETKFERAIASRSGKLDLRVFLDDYAERLEKLVEKKQRAHRDVVRVAAGEAAPESEGGEVIDLMAALRQSLGSGRKPARRSSARKKTAKKR